MCTHLRSQSTLSKYIDSYCVTVLVTCFCKIYLSECCYIAKYYKNRNMYVPKDVKEDVVHMLQLVASYITGSTSHKCGICLNTTAATIKCYSVLTEFRQGSLDQFR